MQYTLYGKPDATEEEKKMAKEYLDADKAAGRYQSGYAGIIGAIVKEDNKYVLLYHLKKDCWTFPTGKVEQDESDEEAVKREMHEELGIDITGLSYLGPIQFKEHNDDYTFHMFKVNTYTGTISNKELNKHARIKYATKQEIELLIKAGTASPMLQLVIDKGYLS